jgi:hypothetical protein
VYPTPSGGRVALDIAEDAGGELALEIDLDDPSRTFAVPAPADCTGRRFRNHATTCTHVAELRSVAAVGGGTK